MLDEVYNKPKGLEALHVTNLQTMVLSVLSIAPPLVRSRVPSYIFSFGGLQKHSEERNETLNSTSVS